MKTMKKGLPPRKDNRHVVQFDLLQCTSTLKVWNERKKALDPKTKSNSELFCSFLFLFLFLMTDQNNHTCPTKFFMQLATLLE